MYSKDSFLIFVHVYQSFMREIKGILVGIGRVMMILGKDIASSSILVIVVEIMLDTALNF